MGVVAAITAVIGTGASIEQNRQATKRAKRAEKTKQRLAEVQAQRERRKQVREALIRRAEVENIATQTGAQGSSSAIAAGQQIGSDLSSNLTFISTQQQLGAEISEANIGVAKAQSRSATFGAIGSVANQFADYSSLFGNKEG